MTHLAHLALGTTPRVPAVETRGWPKVGAAGGARLVAWQGRAAGGGGELVKVR